MVGLQMTDCAFDLESPALPELVNAVLILATPNRGPEWLEKPVEHVAFGP